MPFVIEPEVPGGLGEKCRIDSSVHPPHVSYLHVHLEGWLGDDLLEVFPCFIVTELLRRAFEDARVNGISFEDVMITRSEAFDELYPGRPLPKFWRLNIDPDITGGDFWLRPDYRLAVSDEFLSKLSAVAQINNADIRRL